MKHSPAFAILQKHPLFSGWNKDRLKEFASYCGLHTYAKGKTLFLNEDIAGFCYVVASGWVKLYRETSEGHQAVLDILGAGQLMGESALFNENAYTCSAEIVEEATLIRIPMPLFKAEAQNNNDFSMGLLKIIARYAHQQNADLEHSALQNAPQRIGCYLLRLADQTQEKDVTLEIPYDKALVAARLGMQPETFSRALAKLKNDTGIEVKGATVSMPSLKVLSDYSCVMCSSDFPCKDKTPGC